MLGRWYLRAPSQCASGAPACAPKGSAAGSPAVLSSRRASETSSGRSPQPSMSEVFVTRAPARRASCGARPAVRAAQVCMGSSQHVQLVPGGHLSCLRTQVRCSVAAAAGRAAQAGRPRAASAAACLQRGQTLRPVGPAVPDHALQSGHLQAHAMCQPAQRLAPGPSRVNLALPRSADLVAEAAQRIWGT